MSSFSQNRFCSIRAPSDSCSSLKCSDWSRTAVNSATGTLTRPKLSEPDQSGRAIYLPPAERGLERRHQVRASPPAASRAASWASSRRPCARSCPAPPCGTGPCTGPARTTPRASRRACPAISTSCFAGPFERLRELDLLAVHDLVGEAHRVEPEHAVERADRGEVLAVVEREPAEPGPAGLLERVVQEPVGVAALRPRAEVVRLRVEDGSIASVSTNDSTSITCAGSPAAAAISSFSSTT